LVADSVVSPEMLNGGGGEFNASALVVF